MVDTCVSSAAVASAFQVVTTFDTATPDLALAIVSSVAFPNASAL